MLTLKTKKFICVISTWRQPLLYVDIYLIEMFLHMHKYVYNYPLLKKDYIQFAFNLFSSSKYSTNKLLGHKLLCYYIICRNCMILYCVDLSWTIKQVTLSTQ